VKSLTHHGFTLIEILVVLLIIGITLGFTLISFGDFGQSRRMVMAAEQFVNNVKLVQQQAILEGSTLGIDINDNGYEELRFQAPTLWGPKQSIFHRQHLPKGLIITITATDNNQKKPAIVINSSGEMTAFVLNFGTLKQPSIARVTGLGNGTLSIKTSP
jgi:general secretion pathway protein H